MLVHYVYEVRVPMEVALLVLTAAPEEQGIGRGRERILIHWNQTKWRGGGPKVDPSGVQRMLEKVDCGHL